jgi:hypothetical protein
MIELLDSTALGDLRELARRNQQEFSEEIVGRISMGRLGNHQRIHRL